MIETVVIVGGVALILFIFGKGSSKPTSIPGGDTDICTSCPQSLQGVGVQLLQPGGIPSGPSPGPVTPTSNNSFVSIPQLHIVRPTTYRATLPPRPYSNTRFSQQRIRPDGPMYLYPVSNVGQMSAPNQASRPRVSLTTF